MTNNAIIYMPTAAAFPGAIPSPAAAAQWLRGWLRHLCAATSADAATDRELQRQFEALIAEHGSLISRICFSYAADGDEFCDLRQDVMLNIWRGLPRYRRESSATTWIYRVALNTCVSTIRKRSSRPITQSLDMMAGDMPDNRDDEAARARMDWLHAKIAALSPVDKAIVTMWLDDRSYDEIAEVTGLNRNSVGTRLHRIKEAWRKDRPE